jgi:hypothetical protein
MLCTQLKMDILGALIMVRRRYLAAVQEDFIRELLRMDQLKAAVHAVKDLNLDASFPDLDRFYREELVISLLARGRWAVAAKFVGDDKDLQEKVVLALLFIPPW